MKKNCYFGEKLQELRKKNGLSQEAFAEILDVSRQSVSKWESGKIYPEIDKLIFISEYFNISIDELIKEPSVKLEEDIMPSSERKVINISKPSSKPFAEPPEQDIMPQGYSNIPPVQPHSAPLMNNINYVGTDNKKRKKKIKRKLSVPAVIAVTLFGAVAISLVITAIYENNNSYTDYEETEYVVEMEDDYETANYMTGIMIDSENNPHEYEYDANAILDKVYYYYDTNIGKYIEVLLPIPPAEENWVTWGFDFANVYINDGICVEVVTVNNDNGLGYERTEINRARYYSEKFRKYMPVLVPMNYDEFDMYGYRMVEVYDEVDGQIHKTIVKEN